MLERFQFVNLTSTMRYDFKIFITPDIEVLPVINFIDLEEQIQITSCK